MKKNLLMLKKNLTMLGLSLSLVSSGCSRRDNTELKETKNHNIELEAENERLKEENEFLKEKLYEAETSYKEEDLYIAFINDGEGTPEYRFVTQDFLDIVKKDNYDLYLYKYNYVTNKDKCLYLKEWYYDYKNKKVCMENISFTNDVWCNYWIPNYKKLGNVIRAQDFNLPREYKYLNSYSFEDIKYLEDLINEPGYEVWNNLEDITYDMSRLFVLEIDSKFFIFSNNLSTCVIETNNIENVEDLRMDYYQYSISNPKNAIRCVADESYIDYLDSWHGSGRVVNVTRAEFTSLDKNSKWIKYNMEDSVLYRNLWELLPDEYKGKRELSYDEVIEIENYLNNKNDYTLKKTK